MTTKQQLLNLIHSMSEEESVYWYIYITGLREALKVDQSDYQQSVSSHD